MSTTEQTQADQTSATISNDPITRDMRDGPTPSPAPRRQISPLQDAVERLGDYAATGIEPTGNVREMLDLVLAAFHHHGQRAHRMQTAGRDALDALDRLDLTGTSRDVEAYGVLVAELREALR